MYRAPRELCPEHVSGLPHQDRRYLDHKHVARSDLDDGTLGQPGIKYE